MYTRSQYMNHECTHQQYYEQFVDKYLFGLVSSSIGKERILKSNDPYFNDIPLSEWDRLAPYAKSAGFSLSDCVSTLKAAAQMIKEGRE